MLTPASAKVRASAVRTPSRDLRLSVSWVALAIGMPPSLRWGALDHSAYGIAPIHYSMTQSPAAAATVDRQAGVILDLLALHRLDWLQHVNPAVSADGRLHATTPRSALTADVMSELLRWALDDELSDY